MPTPAFRLRGDQYLKTFSANLTPTENGTITGINIGTNLAYSAGNSILILTSATNKFEAIVTSYTPSTGLMDITEITNIRGSTFGSQIYQINLSGERGTNWYSGTTGPTGGAGRIGDFWINIATGELYQKQ